MWKLHVWGVLTGMRVLASCSANWRVTVWHEEPTSALASSLTAPQFSMVWQRRSTRDFSAQGSCIPTPRGWRWWRWAASRLMCTPHSSQLEPLHFYNTQIKAMVTSEGVRGTGFSHDVGERPSNKYSDHPWISTGPQRRVLVSVLFRSKYIKSPHHTMAIIACVFRAGSPWEYQEKSFRF